MICALFTLFLHSHLKISKIQELLQVVVSSCMECLRAWAGIQIMMIPILRRLHWLSQMSVCIMQASSQWMTTSESRYSYQFDDPDNVVSSFHTLKCSKMDFSDHICALLEILQSSYQECSLGCLCLHSTCPFHNWNMLEKYICFGTYLQMQRKNLFNIL